MSATLVWGSRTLGGGSGATGPTGPGGPVRFFMAPGSNAWGNALTVSQSYNISTSCTIRKLRVIVRLPGQPLLGTVVFSVLKNGVATSLSVTLLGTSTAGSDLVNSVSFAEGDTISISADNNGVAISPQDIYVTVEQDTGSGGTGFTGPSGPTGPGGGPPGPTGPAGGGGLLTFSGHAFCAIESITPSYLANAGDLPANILTNPQNFPVAVTRSFLNMAVTMQTVLSLNASFTVELLRNGVLVPGFVVTFVGGEGGPLAPKSVAVGPAIFQGDPTPDTFDLRVTPGLAPTFLTGVSATIGTV